MVVDSISDSVEAVYVALFRALLEYYFICQKIRCAGKILAKWSGKKRPTGYDARLKRRFHARHCQAFLPTYLLQIGVDDLFRLGLDYLGLLGEGLAREGHGFRLEAQRRSAAHEGSQG